MRALLVIYDNGSYTSTFPQGMGYIARVLEDMGIEVEVYSQDMNHWPEEHLTRYLNENSFDVVGVSVIAGYYQYRKLLALSDAINRSKRRPFYIIGGYGPTPEPEFFMQKTGADAIVLGEGEAIAVELFDAVANKKPLAPIEGIAYRDGDKCVVNPRRMLIEDVDSIKMPAYHLFPVHFYRMHRPPRSGPTDFVMQMMSGRGCTFKCTFCYRMDTGFRARSPENIMEEVAYLHENYGITRFSFYDDLLMNSVQRTEEISKAFLKAKLPVKWDCNGRLNYATPDLLKLMKSAGCVFINYGIEAMDNEVLKLMKKGLRVEQVIKGIENTLAEGISPGLNIIFGNYGDNLQSLKAGVDFLTKYGDASELRTIRPVTPYPGSPLYYDAIKNGLLEGPEDFYERKHLNSDLLAVNFTELTDDEFYEGLRQANSTLVADYYDKLRSSALKNVDNLYGNRDASFRGFRHRG